MFKFITVILLVSIALLFVAPVTLADDKRACLFSGTVELDGKDVSDGTLITATIEGDNYKTYTPTPYGPSTYGINIVPPEGKSYHYGAEVVFHIEGSPADQTSTFKAGSYVRLDLTGSAIVSSASTNVWLILIPIFSVIPVIWAGFLILFIIMLRKTRKKQLTDIG